MHKNIIIDYNSYMLSHAKILIQILKLHFNMNLLVINLTSENDVIYDIVCNRLVHEKSMTEYNLK